MKHTLIGGLLVVAAALLAAGAGRAGAASKEASLGARVQALEDREAIRALMSEYGRTLDARDFSAFARLFAKDGEFLGGDGITARGSEAVGALLDKTINKNFPDSRGTNFHLFSNETIDVAGDHATAVSKGTFVMADSRNRPEALMLATYRDEFVREDGDWKFKRREVAGAIPVPRTSSR
jgi:uncharacterized protein (TIGR02246 family)